MASLKSLLARKIHYHLPARQLVSLPVVNVEPGISAGRSLYDGYQRGAGLEFLGLDRALARDPHFRKLFRIARDNGSVMDEARLMNLYLIIRFFLPEGPRNIIEYGSYRGGSALFMATLLKEFHPGARVFALDTFEGMPQTDSAKDMHVAGDFSDTSIAAIQKSADALGLDNLVLVKGLVEDTAEAIYQQASGFALAHLDLDIYAPLKFAHESVLPHMTPGGYIIYDDATVSSCLGATQVVEEMVRDHGLHCEQIYPHFVFRTGL